MQLHDAFKDKRLGRYLTIASTPLSVIPLFSTLRTKTLGSPLTMYGPTQQCKKKIIYNSKKIECSHVSGL